MTHAHTNQCREIDDPRILSELPRRSFVIVVNQTLFDLIQLNSQIICL